MIRHHFHHFDEHAVLCRGREQHVLEPCLNITDKNLASVFRTPDDVILEAEYCSRVLTVSAICCSGYHVMSLPYNYACVKYTGLPVA